MHGRTLLLLLLAAVLTGCNSAATPPSPRKSAPPLALAFKTAECGTITGTVQWYGDQPHLAPLLAPVDPLIGPGKRGKLAWANPNLPVVDANTGGVQDAVVYLRAVDAAKSRPWDHPPVRVEFREDEMFVVQGKYAGRRGFVHRGDPFEVVSKKAAFETLQVRGASFFSLTLPDVDASRSRRLDQPGVVELSSGVGRFWMRGHLFVVDHPYYVRTDATGHFTLPEVPAGRYQLVCWHPNWHEDVRERDADTCCISRLTFQPAAEVIQDVVVEPGETSVVVYTLSLKDFPG